MPRTKPIKPLPKVKGGRPQWSDWMYVKTYEEIMQGPEPIEVPDHLSKAGVGRVTRLKGCYEYAGKYMLRNLDIPGIRLIHGTYTPRDTGLDLGHAWIEIPENILFDPITQEFYPADEFRNFWGCQTIVSYDRDSMLAAFNNHGHYGPWDEESFRY